MYGNKKNFGMQKKMNIVISCDDNYIMPARIMLESLAAYNTDVSLWIVYSEIQDQNLKKIENDADNYKWDFHSIRINDSIRKIAESLPCNMHFSEEMYYRLFLPWLLPDCERVLYLDCDILVRGSLSELYDFDLEDNYVGAVHDVNKEIRRESIVRLKLKGDYFNSGVQLLQLERIREKMSQEELLSCIDKISREFLLIYPDQDILNKIYEGRIKEIHKKYNYGAVTSVMHKLKNPEELHNAVVVHFISSNKPWKKEYCLFYLREYWSYLQKYITEEQQSAYWRHKPYVRTWCSIVKGFFLRRLGLRGYTDQLPSPSENLDNK